MIRVSPNVALILTHLGRVSIVGSPCLLFKYHQAGVATDNIFGPLMNERPFREPGIVLCLEVNL